MFDQVCVSWSCPSAAPAHSWQARPQHSVFSWHRSSSCCGSDPQLGGPLLPPLLAQPGSPPRGLHPALCHPAPSSLQHSVAVPPRMETDVPDPSGSAGQACPGIKQA